MIPAKTILVVENDPDILQVIRECLADIYVKVVSAGDGEEALAFLRTNALPCLILLDFNMPNMDGFEFRALQLKEERLRNVPVVFMTGLEQIPAQRDEQDQIRCLKKPFTQDELMAIAKRFIA